ncbi:hypothetical protein N431DRAFT_428843 [Stipitochalara longipes BDJ]|nr:hypothetical protein N431DRAFT_428843 [Stipitochalara longipes BDJ]
MSYAVNNLEYNTSFVCRTQVGPTFGIVPISQKPGDDEEDDDQPALVGLGAVIPRWAVSHPNITKLLYFVDEPGFLSKADADFTTKALDEATTIWNNLFFGVAFAATSTKADAHFNVIYGGSSPASEPYLWFISFFPNEDREKKNINVYSYALQPQNRSDTAKVLLHELGHVLGLRHEFAITKSESPAAVQFGQSNADSVMSYSHPPAIQKSDVDAIKEFYSKYKNNEKINNVPIVDETPQPRNSP